MRAFVVFACALVVGAAPIAADAWGADGHRIINGAAMQALPATLPPFVRTPDAIAEVATLGPEADRLKGAGPSWDADEDPGHFLDLDDDGTIAGVVPLAQLPASRQAFDTAVRRGHALETRAADEYVTGFLPYSIIDGWQQIAKDFAIWRVDAYAETHAASDAERATFATDRRLREVLTLRDIGYWGHFVADGSQPLHVSVHYNGWGTYPNPQNYSQSKRIHAKFETDFVRGRASTALVVARMAAYAPSQQPIVARVGAYLLATGSNVPAVYRLDGAGALDAATPEAVSFMLDRLAAGATAMRDMIADAYDAAGTMRVGFPGASVRDVEAGTADFRAL